MDDGQAGSYSGPEVRLEEMRLYGVLLALRSPRTPFRTNFRVGDDPGVGGRDQRDVCGLAKSFSLASEVTRGALPAFLFVIPSLSKCEVFRGAKCMD
jgi:hypothetical protein